MSYDPFEWTCARCGKTYSNPFFMSYPREFWKDNKKRVGDVARGAATKWTMKTRAAGRAGGEAMSWVDKPFAPAKSLCLS